MILLTIAALAAAAPTMTPAEADARCMASFGYVVGNSTDANDRSNATSATLYFTGKLLGRDPAIDLTAALRQAALAIAATPTADISRCAAELQASGARMSAAGDALRAASR